MEVRVIAGHAGRMRLMGRLQAAARGAELLRRKQAALLAAERDLAAQRAEAERAWASAIERAATWMDRATIVDGDGRRRRLAAYVPQTLGVELAERNVMGVRCPRVDSITPAPVPDLSGLGASSALLEASAAYRRAAEAAVRCAAATAAHERVFAELARVAHRRRAIERRWIPNHQRALAQLEVSLEEGEREHAARVRLLVERSAQRRSSSAPHTMNGNGSVSSSASGGSAAVESSD